MKNQPVLDLPKSSLERWLNVSAWLFTALAFAVALGNFTDLPEQIPTHFNAAGEADKFGSKNSIFFLPVLSFVLVAGMTFLAKYPHKFNHLNKITPENAAFEYRRSRMVLLVVNALTALLFLIITWNIVDAALGGPTGLNPLFWLVFITLMIAPPMLLLGWRDNSKK